MEIKKGDIFSLGKHKLMCGDALKLTEVQALMNKKKATMMFTDPPYNINYDRENHSWKHDYKSEIKNFKDVQFDINKLLKLLEMGFVEGAVYMCCGLNQIGDIHKWVKEKLKKDLRVIIWLKSNFSISRGDYNRRYETICYFWFENKKWRGEKSRANTDVWYIQNRNVGKYIHPTQKPLRLIMKALKNNSDEKDIVLDLFGGSGSTLIACEKLNRVCYMMEKMPEYCGKIIERWEVLTGKKAQKIN